MGASVDRQLLLLLFLLCVSVCLSRIDGVSSLLWRNVITSPHFLKSSPLFLSLPPLIAASSSSLLSACVCTHVHECACVPSCVSASVCILVVCSRTGGLCGLSSSLPSFDCPLPLSPLPSSFSLCVRLNSPPPLPSLSVSLSLCLSPEGGLPLPNTSTSSFPSRLHRRCSHSLVSAYAVERERERQRHTHALWRKQRRERVQWQRWQQR